ncbi:MAG: alanine racemase [Thermodesulfobacteriota bacterium]
MRPTWAEIDINSLKSNFLQVKRIVGKDVGIISVVKADAYGHGSVNVSKALIDSGSNLLGVATVEEALELRGSGIDSPILLLGGIQPDEVEIVVKNDLIPSLFSLASAHAINTYAEKIGKKVRYHLKVDTGMNRLGVGLSEVCDFLENLLNFRNLELEGVFTHFANADADSKEPTLEQISVFNVILSLINQTGLNPIYIHSANSAAIQRFTESHMNLVRPGIMLYGAGAIGACGEPLDRSTLSTSSGLTAQDIPSRTNFELKPVMKLKTKITQLKRITAGTPVSYGGTFIASRPSIIATLPIGYADGYMRRLSNRAKVSIRGFTAPVVGTVCMDMTMVDVTEVPGAIVGDEVVLFGDEMVSADDVARWADTIPYEIFSITGKRVPRVYI